MSNFNAFTIVESGEPQKGKDKIPAKPSDNILSEEELNAVEVLYELANGIGPLRVDVEEMNALSAKTQDSAGKNDKNAEKRLGKRKLWEDDSTSISSREVKHLTAAHDTNNYLQTGSGKVTAKNEHKFHG